MTKAPLVDAIMACLPQTQCGECDHPGCLPYAKAIANGEDSIDRCMPGGLPVLLALAEKTQQSPAPWRETVMARYKPPSRVVIDPEQCIGCTKCIQVCPTDAIVGAAKAMHAIIESACTGCDLCLPACPVDCMHPIPIDQSATKHHDTYRKHWQNLYEKRQQRLARIATTSKMKHNQHKQANSHDNDKQALRKKAILEALLREKQRREDNDETNK